jgi:hypothetical protein
LLQLVGDLFELCDDARTDRHLTTVILKWPEMKFHMEIVCDIFQTSVKAFERCKLRCSYVSEFLGFYIVLGFHVEAEVGRNIKNENTDRISCLATVRHEIILTVNGFGIHSGASTIIPEQIALEMERMIFA